MDDDTMVTLFTYYVVSCITHWKHPPSASKMMFDAKFASLALPTLVGKGVNDDEYDDNNSVNEVANGVGESKNKRPAGATRVHCAAKSAGNCTLSQPGRGGMRPAYRTSGW